MTYIKIPKVYAKLKKAEQEFIPVFIYGTTGWGKSMAVDYFYRRKNILKLTGIHGHLDKMPDIDRIRQSVVVIDDVSWIDDKKSQEYCRELLKRTDLHIIVIGRGRIPGWLQGEFIHRVYMEITEEFLAMDEKQARILFDEKNVPISDSDLKFVVRTTYGFPIAIISVRNRMAKGENLEEISAGMTWEDFYHYIVPRSFELWRDDVKDFLLRINDYPDFDEEMATYITGYENIPSIIQYSLDIGNFLTRATEHKWKIRGPVKRFLLWKQKLVMSEEEILKGYHRGASYYEMKGDIANALEYYVKAKEHDEMKRVLEENGNNRASIGYYGVIRKYAEMLSDEEVKSSPIHMSCLSMMYSLVMKIDLSEYWYKELVKFSDDPSNTLEQRKDARLRTVYLDVALPHRLDLNLAEHVQEMYNITQEYQLPFPRFSLTSNTPSFINGAVDFSELAIHSLKNRENVLEYMRSHLGEMGHAITDLGYSEIELLKGIGDDYEILTKLTNSYDIADRYDEQGAAFAAVANITRLHIVRGHLDAGLRRIDTLIEKYHDSTKEIGLRENMASFRLSILLLNGNQEAAAEYLEVAPNEQIDFYILRRYGYLIRLKSLIATNQLHLALDSAMYLSTYFKRYGRNIYTIQNDLLKAIILYRLSNKHWKDELRNALLSAGKYGYVRLISYEGAAILPLLEQYDGECDDAFFEKVLKETRQMALLYPEYLYYMERVEAHLTEREQEILTLMVAGHSTQDICKMCAITYSGLKKHNRNIYKKLGVTSRAEAERAARRLNLI